MDDYKIIIEQDHQTVMAHFEVEAKPAEGHQTEAKLEAEFIKQLVAQGYELAPVKNQDGLLQNLRRQLEVLNDVTLRDSEWNRLLPMITNEQMSIQDRTEMIQGKGYILALPMDDGLIKNIKLIDKGNIFNNRLQVIHQYEEDGGLHKNRYDVTILVNGLPMVHIELKKRGGDIREAFNQINRYQRESFGVKKALYDFVQIFVISTGGDTKYYSNTTRYKKDKEDEGGYRRHKTEGNTFEFTNYWTDQENTLITDLRDFTATFFAKHTLLNLLTKYCVFNVDKELMVMRPYQIAATEKILLRIQTALYNRWQGSIDAGGYIWHTTGSGKTLTSFKTAQLASKMEGIKKVLFVVDRKDLDYQTMREYDKFEKGCANSNSSARILQKQIKDDDAHIIITTIQKLSNLMKPNIYDNDNRLKEILNNENLVLIFDECHRSQFGDMHKLIRKRVKKYLMFGFTGTPIFPVNAIKSGQYSTTEQLFGTQLHSYTIINAIRDKNVLPFHVDYNSTMRMKDDVESKQVWAIDTEEALHNPRRIRIVTRYIINRFSEKTKNKFFNTLFAVDSVKSAILYYNEFKRQLAESNPLGLKVATIFTFNPNEAEVDEWGFESDENPENVGVAPDMQSREALEQAIRDYNQMFRCSYSTDGDSFQSYYKDVAQRMKNKEIDLLIVVGMFLTGFDAKTLNTLWVDKNLKLHGLLQAYSRTNRILNVVKNCGNIVCFRDLEEATNQSLAIFGDENAGGYVLMKTYAEYYETGYDDDKGTRHASYLELVNRLLTEFPVEKLSNLFDEEEKKAFIRLMGEILRVRNILASFDDFTEEAKKVKEMDWQDYLGWYNNFYEEFRPAKHDNEKEDITDDLVFEMELVKQVQININYILTLVQKYHDTNCQDAEIIARIKKLVDASPDMRDKRELIEMFIEKVNPESGDDVGAEWEQFIEEEKREQLDSIIEEENLKAQETYAFMNRAFADGYVTETGTGIVQILPASNPFLPESTEKKQTVIDKLKAFLKKFIGTSDEGVNIVPMQAEAVPYPIDGEDDKMTLAAESDERNDEPLNTTTMETPNKNNSLYLPIKQVYFDQIMAGTKKEEYREISPNTYKKYLACDEGGMPFFDDEIITPEEMEWYGEEWLMACKNGKFPYYFKKSIKFLNLAVGYNKVRDTATVEVTDITPMIGKNPKGQELRFDYGDDGKPIMNPNGNFCMWQAVFHLGEIVEKNIVSK